MVFDLILITHNISDFRKIEELKDSYLMAPEFK
ncbi:MAG: hypothetical protein JWQ84_711 [Mucilaginibacter sp.]|nr:hypothetical protein [Mucilaginibacter sp.]MDB5139167.1 hypothetical protein [Mucilaginibacter sp.]